MEQGTFWDGISKQPHGPRGGSRRGGSSTTPAQKQAYKRKRKATGLCSRCKSPRMINRNMCALHCQLAAEESRKRYKANPEKYRAWARKSQAKRRLDSSQRELLNARSRARYTANRDLFMRHELKRYGLTLEQYRALEKKQRGLCALCGKPPLVGKRACGKEKQAPRLCVDHDHACCPGKRSCGKCVRGLLCHWCNSHVVVGIEKSGASLKQIAEYLGVTL
jgi:hypothetical protein